jgi:DNA replication protein DnaC
MIGTDAASTIVTSQLDIKHWHEMIVTPSAADAILDRLVHNAHRLNLSGSVRRTTAKQAELDVKAAA